METAQSLAERIHNEYEKYFREKKAFKVSVLRMLLAALQTKQIERRGKGIDAPLSDDDVLDVVAREVKKRKESSRAFLDGGRGDLSEKEDAERAILEKYLPPRASGEEIADAVERACVAVKPETAKDFGKVMGEAMKTLKGRAESESVAAAVKERLSRLQENA